MARHPAIADIRDLLTFRIAMLAAANDRMGQDWLQSLYGLRILEWRVLGLVAAREPVGFGEVARALLVDKGQLSRLVKQLGARGLLAAEPDGRDQRLVLLSLTAAGRALHDRVLPVALERNERVVSALSAQE
ncbi:MAG: MarR family transcriptional regulator, partial [Tistlia sp.]